MFILKNSVRLCCGFVVALCLLESISAASIHSLDDMVDQASPASDLSFQSRPEYEVDKHVEDINACIEICAECFKEDLENKSNVIRITIILIIFYS